MARGNLATLAELDGNFTHGGASRVDRLSGPSARVSVPRCLGACPPSVTDGWTQRQSLGKMTVTEGIRA